MNTKKDLKFAKKKISLIPAKFLVMSHDVFVILKWNYSLAEYVIWRANKIWTCRRRKDCINFEFVQFMLLLSDRVFIWMWLTLFSAQKWSITENEKNMEI
jgi:hypothetical protein